MQGHVSWGRWFQLIWLVFLSFPALDLFGKPRPWLEYALGALALTCFVAVFVWGFFVAPWADPEQVRAFRPASLVGMVASYTVMLSFWPFIGANGLGLLIYAGAFSGAQRSPWPAGFAITVSTVLSGWLALTGEVHWLTAATMVFFTLVAAVSNNQVFHEVLSNRALRRSQEDVARIAKVAERERIARDLHDLLGHTLSVIVLKSELAARLADRDPARAAQEIREVERIARGSLQEVRAAVRGYRSSGLEGEFANISLACEAANLRLETYITPLDLEWAQESALAFCLREMLTNVIRHARARTVWVSLERRGDAVALEVWDDGQGTIHEGNGVKGMRERAEAIGGSLSLSTQGGQHGLSVILPLKLDAAAQGTPAPFGLEAT